MRLNASVSLSSPVAAGPTAIPIQMNLINTPNTSDPVASADYVFLPGNLPPITLTSVGGAPITIEAAGFGNATANGFTAINQFHVFEGASASADLFGRIASPCEAVVRNGVSKQISSGTGMSATFTPNFSLSISNTAALCGYDHFNWYQTVTHLPAGHPFRAASDPTTELQTPFIDPVIGGYTYQANGDDSLPFYWGEDGPTAGELAANTTSTSLTFFDGPAWGGLPSGEHIAFNTMLVGVLPDDTWDALYSWNWMTDFNEIGRAHV